MLPTTVFAAKPDHSLFTQALKQNVKNGIVNYKAIKTDGRFKQYIEQLKKTDTTLIGPVEKLAFWINAYNAFTINIVIANYPLKSIKDLGADVVIGTIFKTTIWDKDLVEINGKKMSLNDIENNIIRKSGDARVHFAMVCAAKSCPPLRNEAYEGANLNEQLDDQGQIFLSDTNKNRINFEKKELVLSKIFDWFEEDFERDSKSVIKFIARFVPKEIADKLLSEEKEFDIDYLDYDWSLNECPSNKMIEQ